MPPREPPRRDELYLADMLESVDHVIRFTAGLDEAGWHGDELRQSAVLYRLVVFGEAASRISDEMRADVASVPWTQVRAFRNLAVHGYFAIEPAEVWRIARDDLPALRPVLHAALVQHAPLVAEAYDGRQA